jgi:hypothetical protein
MGLSCELPGETSGQGGRANYPPALIACQWPVEGDPFDGSMTLGGPSFAPFAKGGPTTTLATKF